LIQSNPDFGRCKNESLFFDILSTYDSPICQNALTIYLTQIFSCQIIYDAVIMTNTYYF